MPAAPIDLYLALANELYEGKFSETAASTRAASLPPFDASLLDGVSRRVEELSASQPRRGWAAAFIAFSAADSHPPSDLFLRSRAAWTLARAANHWTQPRRVKEAVAEARQGFARLNETGWLAACDWQENALAWTRPDFTEAGQKLKAALTVLQREGFDEFVPECRLSLAYAQILTGGHEEAMENIRLSEQAYAARADALNRARCWLHQASSLRRQDRFEEAHRKLEQALAVFERENALTDQAKARYQLALGHLLRVSDLAEAVRQFTEAAKLFDATGLDLWNALCINNLGSVYLFTGELTRSDGHYRRVGEIFAAHEISGLLADNLNDHGEVNILRGRPQVSMEQFKRSLEINERLGSRLSAAVAATNLGKACGQYGRYQDALHYLEQAAGRLEALQSHLRLGTCEKYMALIWSQLGEPELAHRHLDRAVARYELAEQKAMLCEAYNIRAAAFFQQGREQEAIACLRDSLEVSLAYGVRPQAALARRVLGEALARADRPQEALDYLGQAGADFSGMEMSTDLAACLVASGNCHVLLGQPEAAQDAFVRALELCEDAAPEIEWRAEVGLGRLAESRSDDREALNRYRRAVAAFSRIRQNFWQPELAGSYLQAPARVFDGIISFASRSGAAPETLLFIEQSKASTLLGQLFSVTLSSRDTASSALDDIESEIVFLQNQLRTSSEAPLLTRTGPEYRQIRLRLREKVEQYEAAKTRLERRSSSGFATEAGAANKSFDIGRFREAANRALKDDWAALDHYLIGDMLVTVMLGPDQVEVSSAPVPFRFRMALDACKRSGQFPEPLAQSDLDVLGSLLIPSALAGRMTPDTFLILSPHRDLHAVPWAALRAGFASEPLAAICIPAVTPSLQSLMAIWQRTGSEPPAERGDGLIVGLSTFGGRHRELPGVKDEVALLASRLGPGGRCLAEENATWENLTRLARRPEDGAVHGLARFAWMHVASHFSAHAQTGRLSGLSLWDGDVWLDKLRDLSPLPKWVTLSACNSLSSFVYEGDEHVDLPAACLAAGADSVVGSLRPVLDQTAAEFTSAFYGYSLRGAGPARAVTLTQRDWMARKVPAGHWAGFLCIGAP